MNRSEETELKKRLKGREDMFLRRLFAMLRRLASMGDRDECKPVWDGRN